MKPIQTTIEYIDNHITERLNVPHLAGVAGFSPFHYSRLFTRLMGIPVMEYVVRRKLQYALYELQAGRKVIDVAADYGFETHAGFTKACRKHLGYPPNTYRLHVAMGHPSGRTPGIHINKNHGGIVLIPKIIRKEAFKVVGYEFRTTLRDNAHTRDIPVFWDECGIEGKGLESKLYHTVKPPFHGEYGICCRTDADTGEFSYIFGVYAEDFDRAEPDMCRLEVPGATYAVFTSPPVGDTGFVDSIKGTWRFILEDWLPDSGYELDDDKLDFEYYDERCHPWLFDKLSMDIYVPVKVRE